MPRVRALLSAWWEANARDLPWRFGRATPWGVLVSEVMSQQTQMSRVVPYWTDWMRVWPDVTALAGASTAEVITAWGRLSATRAGRCGCRSAPAWCSSNTTAGFRKPTTS